MARAAGRVDHIVLIRGDRTGVRTLTERCADILIEQSGADAVIRTGAVLEAYFRQMTHTSSGYARFWSEGQIAFDEPFHSYVATIYAAVDSAVEPDL